jgi:ABC-type nitrate/sulfonate/bicarbonate transport system substrate-binding protein
LAESNRKFKIIIFGVIVLALISVAAVSILSRRRAEVKAGEPFPLRMSVSTAPTNFELAKELSGRDLPAENGIYIEPVILQAGEGGTITMQALLANQVDIAGGSLSIWVNAYNKGAKIKLVRCDQTVALPEHSGALVLEESDIYEIKDLVGKKIAVNVLGAEAEFVIRLFLAKNGISIDDVQMVVLTAAQQEQALRSGQVDAAIWTSSGGVNFEHTVEAGGVRRIPGTSSYEVRGESQLVTSQGFRQEFIDEHPDIVRAFVKAADTAQRIIWEEMLKDPERVRAVYAEITKAKGGNPEMAKYYLGAYWRPENAKITDRDLLFWIDNFEANGTLEKGKIKPSDLYTNEFFPDDPYEVDLSLEAAEKN